MTNPQVSVLMPVFNAGLYLAQSIESILSQTFSNFEFLIFDDGSQDNSLAILQRYANRDKRVRLFVKPHRGYVPWLNEGIALAQGEFIARMDADDVSLPLRFHRQVDYLRLHPECVGVGCDLLMIDPDGDPLTRFTHNVEHAALEEDLLNGGLAVIAHPACMMRRFGLLAAGGYREEYETVEDFDLWLRLAEHGRLANLPEVLFKYRQHHLSVNATQSEHQKRLADHILNEARTRRGFPPLSQSVYVNHLSAISDLERHLEWAMSGAASGYRQTAFKHAFIALGKDPFLLKAWAVFLRCFLPNGIMSFLKRLGLSQVWAKWNGRIER